MNFVNSGVLSFGDMVKNIAANSETAVQTYRRDLQKFGAGLREDTAALRDALRSLTAALDNDVAVEQEPLEFLGQVVDDVGNWVWRRTLDLKKALFDDQDDASCSALRTPRISSDMRRVVADGVEVKGGPVEEGLEERRRSDSSRDSDFTVVSSVRSVLDADELGWDEFEDSGSSGWKKVGSCGSFDRVELRKRLFMAEDDEDLSWDVEDDEPGEAITR